MYIYAIGRECGPVKIGISANPFHRLAAIQIGSPFKISLLHKRRCRDFAHALKHEKSIHEVWRKYRLKGEWFEMDWELAEEAIDCSIDTEMHFDEARYFGVEP